MRVAGARSNTTSRNGSIIRPEVGRALAVLETAPPAFAAAASVPHVGQIALACALGYRDLRFGGDWRADYPRLVGWLEDFAARVPSFAATAVKV
jgi:glutathione S-transferase